MKKLLLIAICCMFGMSDMLAQSSSTKPEIQFRNKIEQFLKEEGYLPTVDNEDESLNWKKEGVKYWLTVESSEPYYIRMHEAGCNFDKENKKKVIEACNYANKNKRCGKATVGNSTVSFTVEYYVYSINGFKQTFYANMRAVNAAKTATKAYYNGDIKE
jgi:P pilus assembly chaperone PapD